MFGGIFGKSDKQILKEETEAILEEYIQYPIVYDKLKEILLRGIDKIKKEDVSNILKQDREEVVYNHMVDILIRLLRTGNYHASLGLLNSMTGGTDMLIVLKNVLNKCVNKKMITPEDKNKIIKNLENEIAELG